MKKRNIIAVAFFMLLPVSLIAQTIPNIEGVKMKDSVSWVRAEGKVLDCYGYLFKTTCVENAESLALSDFCLNWMSASPQTPCGWNKDIYMVLETNQGLLQRYFAAMAKVAIESHPDKCTELQYQALCLVLDYALDKNHEAKITKKIQKLIDLREKNQLMDFVRR